MAQYRSAAQDQIPSARVGDRQTPRAVGVQVESPGADVQRHDRELCTDGARRASATARRMTDSSGRSLRIGDSFPGRGVAPSVSVGYEWDQGRSPGCRSVRTSTVGGLRAPDRVGAAAG